MHIKPSRTAENRAAHWQSLINEALKSRFSFRDAFVLHVDKRDLHELFTFVGLHPGAAPVGGCFDGLADLPGGWCADCDAVRRKRLSPTTEAKRKGAKRADAAWRYRNWLLVHPRPSTVRVHHGTDDNPPHVIRLAKRNLARIGESIAALKPDLVEAMDGRGKLLRALRPWVDELQATLEAKEQQPKPKRFHARVERAGGTPDPSTRLQAKPKKAKRKK